MKNTIYTLIIGLFLFSACDKIEGPYVELNNSQTVVDDFPELDRSSVYRKILMEEFTGHLCVNCPVGHAKISELASLFGDTLVPICIHAGTLANPAAGGLFIYNFKTPEGDKFFQDFEVSEIPSAVVNRVKHGGDS